MNVAGGALLAMGVAVVVVAAPVAGAFIGAALTTNAIAGGIAGFTIGALTLPLPFAALVTKDPPTEAKDIGKSRLRRIAEEVVSLYKSVGGMFASVTVEAAKEKFGKKPAVFVPYDNSDDPFRIGELSPAFEAATVTETPQPQAKPELKLVKVPAPPQR